MSSLQILTYPDDRLKQLCDEVPEINADIKGFIQQLEATRQANASLSSTCPAAASPVTIMGI